MCRLYGFRGSAPTKVDCSLVRAQNALLAQSRKDRRGVSNADGWGIGFYENGRPAVEKCDTAAFRDLRFSEIAERVSARTVLAHVRKATVGRTSSANTHPFSYGVWTLAHNGTLTAFDKVAPSLESEIGPELLGARGGTTDTELIFVWLLGRMAQKGIAADAPCRDRERLLAVFGEAVRSLAAMSDRTGVEKPAKLNLLLTDGRNLVASRWGNTLYRVTREGVRDCEICGRPHVEPRWTDGYRAAAVASEPITGEPWEVVPEGSIVSISRSVNSEVIPIS